MSNENTGADSRLNHDVAQAADFLARMFSGASAGYINLVAIDAFEKLSLVGCSIPVAKPESVAAFIDKHSHRWNIYYCPNPLRHKIDSKASRADVQCARFIQADGDIKSPGGEPRAASWYDEQKAALAAALKEFGGYTLLVDSGGGVQLLAALREPTTNFAACAAASDELRRRLQAACAHIEGVHWDSVGNVDRILRLPGSVNFGSSKKRAAGRTGARRAAVLDCRPDFVVDLPIGLAEQPQRRMVDMDFERRLGELKLSAETRERLLEDRHLTGDRSADLFACECALAAIGVRPADAASLLLAAPGQIGDKAREKGADWLATDYRRAIAHVTPSYVHELNEKYFAVIHGGSFCVVPEPKGSAELEVIRPDAFRMIDPRLFTNPRKPNTEDHASSIWLRYPWRRQYAGIELDPSQPAVTAAGRYNLWRGFAFEPRESGTCERFKAHLLAHVCGGNRENYEWMLNLLAKGIRRPEEPLGACLVMRGPEGHGKGILARTYVEMFGVHGRHLAESDHVSGSFNAHLASALALYIDEAFFGHDRKTGDKLKGWITEPTLALHAKFKDIVYARNRLKIIISSNHEDVVPAGPEARRYFITDVENPHGTDPAYWNPIYDELAGGGRQRWLWELGHRDLSGFDVHNVPRTAALRDVQVGAMEPAEQWLLQVLRTGRYGRDRQFASAWGRVPKGYCWLDFQIAHPKSKFDNNVRFGRKICKILRGHIGELSTPLEYRDIGAANNRFKRSYTSEQYVFAPLDACRAAFAAHMKWTDYPWPLPLPAEEDDHDEDAPPTIEC